MTSDTQREIEIDRLRLAAFKTNSAEDKTAYYLAASVKGLEQLAREIAVTMVDAIHGYTVEFAPSPSAHLDEYNRAESAASYALSSIIPATKGGETHRHLKSGHLVRVIGTGKMQSAGWYDPSKTISTANVDMREVVIYEHDGNLWVRPVEEFNDGRFLALSAQDTDGEER